MVCRGSNRRRGTALIEFPLFFLLLLYLFLGAVDMGFYCYALTAVQNAARVAALYTSSSSSTQTDAAGACSNYVLPELQALPNHAALPSGCNQSPLHVTATTVSAPDGTSKTVSKVTVTYTSIQLIPVYGLPGQMTMARSVALRVRP